MKVIDIKNLDISILPTKKVEEFRSFNIYPYFEKDFDFKKVENIDLNKYSFLKDEHFINIFFVNNKIVLEDKIDEFIEITYENFENSFNSLYKLNSYLDKEVTTLKIKKELEKPLNIINIFEGDNKFFTSSLNIEAKVNCDILETFHNEINKDSFISANRKYLVKKDIKANIAKVQTLNNAQIIVNYKTQVEENATLNLVNLEYKANLAVNIFDSKLEYENANFNFDGIIKNNENQKSANIMFVEHIAKSSISDVKIKHLLDGQAHALFDVASKVQNSALYSKAFQNSQTILLSDDARINANPRLEIFIDELEAAHGASCGALDEDQLYYLCSRGISKEKAKEMIIDSIELKVIKRIELKAIRRYIKNLKRLNHV
ncbi:hypothetical protein CPU12_10765 [Malaciobacter molluscorum LMG 25693]|uniref:[Fe-S] cluster assembly scaffold SufBCD, SufD protein n=1 Tax=Malaciobacter molluscorum LMG 25693 TaxID=870501 RepID=A0A2G1DFW0_9BACT|nr:SufD family Fe-S cluster assembly protein [Malaciobacter molluscorum]AXX91714.1 [Fe-S] cluster assembly scaffold SufBCD, SufD protein [Malaciobacter molluscorum LMG 25693]PHO17398.1 hypothetical protein CPU12_10765 [Malaciobacter molluscorum LMG 25693]